MIPAIILILLALIACAGCLIWLRKEHRIQHERIRQLRSSDLYSHLYPILMRCAARPVESVALTSEAVTVRLLDPPGRTLTYHFSEHGSDDLSETTLYTLAQAVAVDLRFLRGQAYRFYVRRQEAPNGTVRRTYTYFIRSEYKSRILWDTLVPPEDRP